MVQLALLQVNHQAWQKDAKMQIRKSFLLSVSETYTVTFIGFISSVILARLLTPAEVGIFSIASIFVGVGNTVREFGIGPYVIQEKELTGERLQAAFALNLGIGLALCLLTLFASPYISNFYGSPKLKDVLLVLAFNFALIPFGSVTMAYLRRELSFGPIYIVKLCSSCTHLLVSVLLAYLGYGPISLAWAALAGIIVTVIGLNFFRPAWFSLKPSLGQMKHVFSFASQTSLTSIIREICLGLPELVVGKVLGLAPVGLLGRAMGTVDIFTKVILSGLSSVVMPVLSMEARAGREAASFYLRICGNITALSWPFFALLGIHAKTAIMILYGPQWLEAVPLVQALCVMSIIVALHPYAGDLLLSRGKPRQNLRMMVITQAIRISILCISVFWGLQAVCYAFILSQLINSSVIVAILRKEEGVSGKQLLLASRRSMLVTVAAVVTSVIFGMIIEENKLWLHAIFIALGAILGWLGCLFLVKHELADEASRALGIVSHWLRERIATIRSRS
ncbi:MAG: lipopolysaccharide biosynthesis protein [Burkholderiales bacterium]